MTAFAINANFEGDFVMQLVAVDTEDTMDQVAEKCAYHSIGRRVAAQPEKVLRVRMHQATENYPRDMKVVDAGWRPTETLDIIFADS